MNQRTDPSGDIALSFLESLRPGGPWVLTAIHPTDGKYITTATFSDPAEVCVFVRNWNGHRNLYYSVNPTRDELRSKASKADIAAIEFITADCDPGENETPEAAKARYLAKLDGFVPTPGTIVDSGNGIQALWRLDEPITLPDPVLRKVMVKDKEGREVEKEEWVYTPEGQALVDDIELRGLALLEILGSATGTQNIDRILRLPGTINLPSKAKQSKGRTECRAGLIKPLNGATCSLSDFPVSSGVHNAGADTNSAGSSASGALDWNEVEKHSGWLKSAADLPPDFSKKGRAIVALSGNLKDLNFHLQEAGIAPVKPYQSWSHVCLALAAIFKHDGRFSNEQIAAALLADLTCNQHIKAQSDVRRAVERAVLRSHEPRPGWERRPGEPVWREQRVDGKPTPSMHNARLAITALDIECKYDTFHNKLLFGFKGDQTRHAIEHIAGEVTDNGIIALRQLMSESFGFDLTDKHTRDAVISLAIERCFDPVRDMLAEAEASWDGVPRLDRMAADYFNCVDTPLNAAFMRKTMIAAVARARVPGIKFDQITVLESGEGFNKSTAWRVLAGDENFSDENIIGKNGREVQEQLSEIWIHENADLAGLKKAEIETVKAYASRMIDIARPAYGHFVKKQPRHSIEVGTTNSAEYLQSQTGNRRFWPLKVLKAINIEMLKRDRLQLWGEAAHYQSQGESLFLDESMWAVAAIEQEARRISDPWEDALADMPKEVQVDLGYKDGFARTETVQVIYTIHGERRVAAATLLGHILKIKPGSQQTSHTMRLSNTMRKLGWQRHDNGYVTIGESRVKGYFRQADEWGDD
jgi:predicted P-loop ATPase